MTRLRLHEGLFTCPASVSSMTVKWRLLRIKPRFVYSAIVCSDDLAWVPTHYYRGRSVPCIGVTCQVCKYIDVRWYAYAPVILLYQGERQNKALIELPIGAALKLGAEVKQVAQPEDDSWLGVEFQARRSKNTMRSPVAVEFIGIAQEVELCDLEDVHKALCRMWGVPEIDASTDLDSWREIVKVRLGSDEHYEKKNGSPRR